MKRNNKIFVCSLVFVFACVSSMSHAAANGKRSMGGGGTLSGETSSTVKASTKKAKDRGEWRYYNSVNSFKGTVRFVDKGIGHSFVQIIKNDSNNRGVPMLLIHLDKNGYPKNIGREGGKTTCKNIKIKDGQTIYVKAKIESKQSYIELKRNNKKCKWTAEGGNAPYIKFGSYGNGSASGTQKVEWTGVSPRPEK